MNDSLLRDVKNLKKRHARRRAWHGILTLLVSIVVFATTYALILPAITMTANHIHDESCYTQVTETEKEILACPVSSEDGLVVVHRHDSRCYDEDGSLVCTLPELAAHTHTEDCYAYPEAHVHTEDCYSNVCGELLCGLEEGEGHTHTEDCYAWETVLSCGRTEGEAAEPVLVCGKKEIVLHRHDEDCYASDGTLTCALPEVIEHQHTSKCFKTVRVPVDTETLTCTNEDPDHVHTALCYGTWVLTCDQGTDEPEDPADEEPAPDEEPEGPADEEIPEDPTDEEEPDDPDAEDPENPAEDEEPTADEYDTRAGQVLLKYYIYLDDEPHLVLEEYASLNMDNGRYYTTAEQLETVYGTYGFRADTYSGERFFPHTDHNDPAIIWADAPAYQAQTEDGGAEWRIPLSRRVTSYIYYLPNNAEGSESYFTDSKDRYDASLIRDNTFYTVNISAPPDAASESGIYYVLNGTSFYTELSMFADYAWSFTSLKDGSKLTPDSTEKLENGKIAVTFDSVTCPIKIAALHTVIGNQEYTIVYRAGSLADNLQRLSSEVGLSTQQIITDGKVGGMATLTEKIEVTPDMSYQLRVPDEQTLVVQSNMFKSTTSTPSAAGASRRRAMCSTLRIR